jgi:hypothetical protein
LRRGIYNYAKSINSSIKKEESFNMEKRENSTNKNQTIKAYQFSYDQTLECMILDIKDEDGMFPIILRVPSAGPYRITRNKKGKLQMTT